MDISKMYEEYPFTSSTNSSMPKILKDVLDSALLHVDVNESDLVLDIGGNDGTLLSFLRDKKCDLLCIDAAKNIKPVFKSSNFNIVNDFFNERIYKSATNKKAKIVFSIAMFYHLSDPVQFAKDIEACLADDGIWVIQMAYLPAMIKTTMYDNIVHEHVGYYAADHLRWIMEKANLEIFDVMLNDVYGGSFRIFIKKKGFPKYAVTDRYNRILAKEKEMKIYDQETYVNFMKRIKKTRADLLKLCRRIESERKKIWVYGASTKGNTILQYCGITNDLIDAAADSNPFKFGKYIIGADIPIKSEDQMRAVRPDYLLALPYSFVDAFMKRENDLIKNGTKFIVPLPNVRIIP
ncbi:MAG: class I SAM-dependent methyltransferase [Actinobacteria bacterium]|nr:class I SAM-dependent methyltransferase [Actinomycetota bacterium]